VSPSCRSLSLCLPCVRLVRPPLRLCRAAYQDCLSLPALWDRCLSSSCCARRQHSGTRRAFAPLRVRLFCLWSLCLWPLCLGALSLAPLSALCLRPPRLRALCLWRFSALLRSSRLCLRRCSLPPCRALSGLPLASLPLAPSASGIFASGSGVPFRFPLSACALFALLRASCSLFALRRPAFLSASVSLRAPLPFFSAVVAVPRCRTLEMGY
jgi:hypothetical protein